MNTQQIRSRIKAKRAALDTEWIEQTSQLMAKQMGESVEFKQAEHIAYYLPVSGEANPTLLLKREDSKAKSFYLPVIEQKSGNRLKFIKVSEGTKFQTNKYGILEPIYSAKDVMQPNQLDLVITPLVSFDEDRNRVGMGGGFYDRTFAFKKSKTMVNPLLIGFAYEFQRSDKLISETWDVKLDGVVTEHNFIR